MDVNQCIALQTAINNMSINKPNTSMTHVAEIWETKPMSILLQ